ncbi:MAG: alkaline phosphatase family protein [Polyangiaceae bacterium]
MPRVPTISQLAAGSLALGLAACAPPPAPPEAPPRPRPARVSPAVGEGHPRLVVAVVIDQLGSWVLERYLPHLDPEGALRRATREGVYFERSVYPYASTFTAPGHAAIFTGRPPSDTGIVANSSIDPRTGEERTSVEDEQSPVFGDETKTGSPRPLRVPTVGDALKAAHPNAKVVALSTKDRASILPGGHRADLAVWYDYHLPGYTTSRYYADLLPEWLADYRKSHPISALLKPWVPADPQLLRAVVGEDDAEGEGDYQGLGRTFPHDPEVATKPYSVLRIFPQMTEYMLELAGALASAEQLGADDQVDLLCLSISGLDYTGHTFGPESWEYLDHFRRADRALGRLIDALDEHHGPIAVLITADHGITPTPAKNPAGGGRIYPYEVTALAKRLVPRPEMVRLYERPFVYLDPELSSEERAAAVAALEAGLTEHPGVHRAVGVERAAALRSSADPIDRAIGLSIAPNMPGEVYVVPAENWVVDEDHPRGGGTTHGTPWRLDREVPVIVWRGGAPPQVVTEPVSQLRVAPTLAALLGVSPPEGVVEPPLEAALPAAAR